MARGSWVGAAVVAVTEAGDVGGGGDAAVIVGEVVVVIGSGTELLIMA